MGVSPEALVYGPGTGQLLVTCGASAEPSGLSLESPGGAPSLEVSTAQPVAALAAGGAAGSGQQTWLVSTAGVIYSWVEPSCPAELQPLFSLYAGETATWTASANSVFVGGVLTVDGAGSGVQWVPLSPSPSLGGEAVLHDRLNACSATPQLVAESDEAVWEFGCDRAVRRVVFTPP